MEFSKLSIAFWKSGKIFHGYKETVYYVSFAAS